MDAKEVILKAAEKHNLDADLLLAIAHVESGTNAWKVRFEPGWKYLLTPRDYASRLLISVETETVCQSMSWGPLQIMGTVARELGFQDDLTQLVNPEIAVELSCRKLTKLFQKYGNQADVVASWNAGSPRRTPGGMYVNETYVDKVFDKLRLLKKID